MLEGPGVCGSVTNSKNKAAKPSTSTRQLVPLDKRTVAGRLFNRMQRDIEADLGGRRQLSRIEQELIGAFLWCFDRAALP